MNRPDPSPARPALAWSRGADWICALALLALWLVCRPYRGIRHDAVLYTGQVLAKLLPDRVGTDLFFAYGSQDKYSLFSPLMVPLVQRFGVGPTELVLLLLCNLLFMAACWCLIRPWVSRPLGWAALLLAAGLPHTYGGLGAFSYSEPFLTARSFAEPLALFALAQLLRGRLALAIGAGLLGAAFHPLIALPVFVVGWGVLIQQRRAWSWAGMLFIAPIALAFAHVAPFTGLLQIYDDAWFAEIRQPNSMVFMGSASVLDWAPLAFDVLVLALCLRIASLPQVLRRLAIAILVAVFAFTVAWGLGADVLHDVLLTQLQLWRIYWLLHLVGVLLLPLLAADYWQRGWVGRWCVAALALAAVAVLSNWNTGWMCLVWALLALAADFGKARISRATAAAAIAASAATVLLISARVMLTTQQAVGLFPDRFGHVVPAMILVGLPLGVGLIALAFVRLAGGPRGARVVAALLAVAAVGCGAGVWDQRSAWQLRLEADMAITPAFEANIPDPAVVYWDRSLVEPWLLARRANFFDFEQGAGLLFNRRTAIEYGRRERAVAGFELQRELCATVAALGDPGRAPAECPMSAESVVEVCHATPHPDFLVFQTPVALPEVARWQDTSAGANAGAHTFHLYSCDRLR